MSHGPGLIQRLVLIFQGLCLLTVMMGAADCTFPRLASAAEQETLYERLGGYDIISQIVDGFLKRMWADPQVGRFFVGMGTDTRDQLRQKNKLLLCKNTGGPCRTINRSMKLAHGGLGITENDWQIAVNHFVETLKSIKVGEPEQQELLQIIGGLKGSIVERPGQ